MVDDACGRRKVIARKLAGHFVSGSIEKDPDTVATDWHESGGEERMTTAQQVNVNAARQYELFRVVDHRGTGSQSLNQRKAYLCSISMAGQMLVE